MAKSKFLIGMFLLFSAINARAFAADPLPSVAGFDKNAPPAGTQAMRSIAVHITNEDNQPVADVLVNPYALRSSQGLGLWQGDDKWATVGPKVVRTDSEGNALIAYPYYRDVKESVRTLEVSIKVSHPNYVLPDTYYIVVPSQQSPYEIKLKKGASIEVRPMIDGHPVDPSQISGDWSEPRSGDDKWNLEKTANSTLRLPPMLPTTHSVLLAKFNGDRLTYLSSIVSFPVKPTDNPIVDVPLKQVKQVKGTLDASVPRPVKSGRVQARTIPSTNSSYTNVLWMTWGKVESDGSFTIDDWPQDEAIQVIALCEGFIGKSGDKPAAYSRQYDPATDNVQRPQCFAADATRITIAMEPLVQCVVRAVDTEQKPVPGLKVASYPNVGWWNIGSTIYCAPGNSVRSVDKLKSRKFVPNNTLKYDPYNGLTDSNGQVFLYLPQGTERVAIESDEYELPINLGRREITVDLKIGEIARLNLDLQRRGTDKLGDWDKMTGVLRESIKSQRRAVQSEKVKESAK